MKKRYRFTYSYSVCIDAHSLEEAVAEFNRVSLVPDDVSGRIVDYDYNSLLEVRDDFTNEEFTNVA